MKKRNLIFSILSILLFQLYCYGQEDIDYFRVNIPPESEELIELRTASARTYHNSDGTFTTVIAPSETNAPYAPYVRTPRKFFTVSPYAELYEFGNASDLFSLGRRIMNFYDGINRCFVQWNIPDIPSNATNISSSFIMYSSIQNSIATSLAFYPVSSSYGYHPNNSDADEMYIDCEDGTSYGTVSKSTNASSITFTGNSAFNSAIQSGLSADWMGVGIKNTNESSNSYYCTFYSTSAYLNVSYEAKRFKITPFEWVEISGDGSTLEDVTVERLGTSTDFTYGIVVTSGSDWIELSTNSGTTPGSLDITAKPNFTGAARTGNVRFTATGVETYNMKIYQSNFASTLILPTQEVSGLQTYKATNWIEANSFLVGKGGNVGTLNLYAGNKITLKPGFTAKSDDGTFLAKIQSFGDAPDFTPNAENESKEILTMKDGKTIGSKQSGELTPDVIPIESIPTEYDLFQNYPNPFNPNTNIRFALPEKAIVKLAVYNLLGQQVAEIANTEMNAGFHTVNFNGSLLTSGIYFYRISTEKFSKTMKLLLVK